MGYLNAAIPRHSSTPLTERDWQKVDRLYEEGQLDIAIAEELGCSSKTIARWRWKNNLPRNDRAKPKD